MVNNKEEELKKLGKRIKQIRLSKNLTQADLAARIGKDQQSIQRLEAGRVNPSYIYLLEIGKGLEVEIGESFQRLP